MKRISFTTIFIIACFIKTVASTITVSNSMDSGSGSLREAIYNAIDGDVIEFDDYYTIYLKTPIELGDKNISIDGLVGDNKVILDGNYLDADNDTIDDDGVYTRIFTITGGNDKEISLSNLIIQHGSTDRELDNGSSEDSPLFRGGGLYIDMTEGGTFTATSCTIQNNILSRMVDGNEGDNQVYLQGAGIYSEFGGNFVDCVIKNNVCIAKNSYQCNLYAAGAYTTEGGSFSNCMIAGNKILFSPINNQNFYAAFGAGLYLNNNAEVTNCVIVGNYIKNVSDEFRGYFNYVIAGGILTLNSRVCNTTIAKNGIYNIFELGDQDQVGCGGAMLTYSVVGSDTISDYCKYQNNIFFGNYCSSDNFNNGGSAPEYTKHSAFPVSDEYDVWDLDDTNIFLDENPFFELPSEGDDGEWGTEDDYYGDLRLKKNNACIDAGNPDDTDYNALSMDFYGRQRITNGLIDIGAVESLDSDFTYSLRGSVWEGTSSCSEGKVYAISIDNMDEYAEECNIDENGDFEFTELYPGEYYFLATPDNQTYYSSTYYGDESSIENAISINVDDIIYDVDIHLIEIDSITTASESLTDTNIHLYPNPATDYIYITESENISKICLYNSLGIKVVELNKNTNSIPVYDLPNGIYIISMEVNNRKLSFHFMKK